MKARIKKEGKEICRVKVAESFVERAIGLMFKKELREKEGLLIRFSEKIKSRSLHGFFMRFSIVLIFLDDDFKIVEIAKLKPWRIYSAKSKSCKYVLEVNEGFVKENGIKKGDTLEVEFIA